MKPNPKKKKPSHEITSWIVGSFPAFCFPIPKSLLIIRSQLKNTKTMNAGYEWIKELIDQVEQAEVDAAMSEDDDDEDDF